MTGPDLDAAREHAADLAAIAAEYPSQAWFQQELGLEEEPSYNAAYVGASLEHKADVALEQYRDAEAEAHPEWAAEAEAADAAEAQRLTESVTAAWERYYEQEAEASRELGLDEGLAL